MPSFFIQNFGCRVNQAEAFAWARELQEAGVALAEDWRDAEAIVINSCTLTHRADRDVRKFIQKAARECPATRIVVTGCYVEREREAIAAMPGVAGVFGNGEKTGLVRDVLKSLRAGRLEVRPDGRCEEARSSRTAEATSPSTPKMPAGLQALADPEEGRIESDGDHENSFRARALVKIQDGCNNRCTFCVIPSVRGRSASVPAEEIVAAVADLSARGYREIVLAGIHLSSWGDDLEPRGSLTDLLRPVEAIEGLGRIRLSSLDPRRMEEEFVEHVAANDLICQHFHLSLQHASGRVLKRMGRGGEVGAAAYISLLRGLRERSPEAAIGADIIVGFPEEKDEDFAVLEEFLRRSPLTYFHVFSYSPRRGTPAATWEQVAEPIKKARSQALRRLSAERNLRFRESLLGHELEAVVIRRSAGPRGRETERNGVALYNAAEVLTGNYVKVVVPRCPAPERELVRVRITRVGSRLTEGEVV